jgi:hypothetical protein
MKQSTPTKRLVIVHGDKGGVGKSTFARLLADYYTQHAPDWRGYDTDPTNGHLLRFYSDNTKPINIHDPASLDQLLNALETEGVAHWLVDLGAQSGDRLVQWMAETDFLTVCGEMNIAVTIAFVISPIKDSTVLLKIVSDQLGSGVSYVVVKNEATGRGFPIYDGSKTRARLTEELGAVEIRMPEVLEHVYYKVDQLNLPWTAAVGSRELDLAERQRVKAFTRAAFAEIEKAAAVLIGKASMSIT